VSRRRASKRRSPGSTPGQAWAVEQFKAIAVQRPHQLQVVEDRGLGESGFYWLTLSLPTGDLERVDGGLVLRDSEQVEVAIPPNFPLLPPVVAVEHYRFAGHPHVLQGHRLCLYLDHSREWRLDNSVVRFLQRLWTWFEEAAGARHDPAEAMYHPVGGVLHESDGTPMVVARQDVPLSLPPLANAYLHQRTAERLDLFWHADPKTNIVARVLRLRDPLYFSAGSSLAQLLDVLDRPRMQTAAARQLHHGWPSSEAVLTAMARTSQRNTHGTPLYFVVAAPHPTTGVYHLLTGRLPAYVADGLRKAGRELPYAESLSVEDLPGDARVEWCAMSDERPEITTRRDNRRPVSAYRGKRVHIWGCGGLGSWMAEFIARAGAAEITLCDGGRVAGGLLVRQNYGEADLGMNKAKALANRLRAVSDDLVVKVHPIPAPADESWLEADVLVDATVNTALAQVVDIILKGASVWPTIARVATDVRTASLGLLIVSTPEHGTGPYAIDQFIGSQVLENPDLEQYHTFWRQPAQGDELVPARGCSVPTFHGSSADLAGIAASLTTFLGLHLQAQAAGMHLMGLPHADGGGSHHFLPAPDAIDINPPLETDRLPEIE
jgi:hypothetical protein